MHPTEFVTCPCCQSAFSRVDAPVEWQRVSNFNPAKYAARVLGERNAGHKKHLSPAQREARRVQLAINRGLRYKLQVVNDATGEAQDSLLKGADMLSSNEADQIIKKGGLVPGFHYVKICLNPPINRSKGKVVKS